MFSEERNTLPGVDPRLRRGDERRLFYDFRPDFGDHQRRAAPLWAMRALPHPVFSLRSIGATHRPRQDALHLLGRGHAWRVVDHGIGQGVPYDRV